MKDTMMFYGVTLGRRYKENEKNLFRQELEKRYRDMGYPVETLEVKEGNIKATHIIVGKLKEARHIYVSSYDTPSKLLLPWFPYYPFHIAYNLRVEKIMLTIQLLCTITLSLAFYLYASNIRNTLITSVDVIIALILCLVIYYLFKGRASRVNFNRNSASLAIMDEIGSSLDKTDQVAFVFLDQAVMAYRGHEFLKKIIGDSNQQIIFLDCLAKGESIYMVHREEESSHAKKIGLISQEKGLEIISRVYTEDKAKNNVLAFGRHMLYIVSGRIEHKEFIVRNTRTNKDTKVDMMRLEKLARVFIDYSKSM